jgi:hypothetical protein
LTINVVINKDKSVEFTREPIVETIVTPREGHKLVVRNSKGTSQEEYFVDAVEIVSFGNAFFFRSLERPKNFLVPINDYEVVEVREARMVLKHVGVDRSIKIGGGRKEAQAPQQRVKPQPLPQYDEEFDEGEEVAISPPPVAASTQATTPTEGKNDRKRDRRNRRRRRGGEGSDQEGSTESDEGQPQSQPKATRQSGDKSQESFDIPQLMIAPPDTLISETIGRYKGESFLVAKEEGGESRNAGFCEAELDKGDQAEFGTEPAGDSKEGVGKVFENAQRRIIPPPPLVARIKFAEEPAPIAEDVASFPFEDDSSDEPSHAFPFDSDEDETSKPNPNSNQ